MSWLDFALPRVCFGCGRNSQTSLCEACHWRAIPIQSPKCPRCAQPREVREGVDAICAACLAKKRWFDAVHAAFEYAGPIRTAITRAKIGRDPLDFRAACEFSRDRFPHTEFGDWPVVRVPMYRRDLRRRGFSTVQIFADVLFPEHPRLLAVRKKASTNQRTLTREEREKNARIAFESTGLRAPESVLLVDDVMTTGSTMNALARILKRNGAKRVVGIVLARDV